MQSDENKISNSSAHYSHKYLQYASLLIASYNGKEPFHLFIKKYFSLHKKHGSKDRKVITALCYNYFRVCMGFNHEVSIETKILAAFFLCESKPSVIDELYNTEWKPFAAKGLNEKLDLVKDFFDLNKIFPLITDVSDLIDQAIFFNSFLKQPKIFIRVRPGYENQVTEKLSNADIEFEKINNYCLSLLSNKKISDVLLIDKEAVIQDYNSQRILNFLPSFTNDKNEKLKVWDCCAGSGGKALLVYDTFKNIQLTVSDIRKNILKNLQLRFANACIKNYTLVQADLQMPIKDIPDNHFNLIIADVPCSGSGTWSRTPEQLSFFNKKEIEKYAVLQKTIISNIIKHVQHNCYLLYVTCSVFEKENEENISFFQNEYNLDLIKTDYLRGYEIQADTLFAALFIKNK